MQSPMAKIHGRPALKPETRRPKAERNPKPKIRINPGESVAGSIVFGPELSAAKAVLRQLRSHQEQSAAESRKAAIQESFTADSADFFPIREIRGKKSLLHWHKKLAQGA